MAYDMKIFAPEVEPGAVHQIYELLAPAPRREAKVRSMPDVHSGMGCVVGFTATGADRMIPGVIGGDMGCGMLTVELGRKIPELRELDQFIWEHIPAGAQLREDYDEWKEIKKLCCYSQLRDKERVHRSLGTLGGGNHFIEVDQDGDGRYYLVIHSGSRFLGTQVAAIYQRLAVRYCREAGIKAPEEYCYLTGAELEAYLQDMAICVAFASENRKRIAKDILAFMGIHKAASFETIHNFVDGDGVIRKGAVPAHAGQKLLIPMNMRDGCLIAEGKGNPDWNFSAPHGAGRAMSRGEAKAQFTVEQYAAEMAGIYSSTVNASTLDESPMAYKDMAGVLEAMEPTVKILKRIRPVYNFKAGKRSGREYFG